MCLIKYITYILYIYLLLYTFIHVDQSMGVYIVYIIFVMFRSQGFTHWSCRTHTSRSAGDRHTLILRPQILTAERTQTSTDTELLTRRTIWQSKHRENQSQSYSINTSNHTSSEMKWGRKLLPQHSHANSIKLISCYLIKYFYSIELLLYASNLIMHPLLQLYYPQSPALERFAFE